jgi:hypothetical protein
MRPLNKGKEAGGIVKVYAGAEAAPGYGCEFERFVCWYGYLMSKPLAQRIFDQLRERLTSVVSEALSRFKQLAIEMNCYSHKFKDAEV